MIKEINQEALTGVIHKQVLSFCKLLPSHVEKWTLLLADTEKPVQALVNFSEQLRHVEQANIKYIEEFKELQDKLSFKILSAIEDEISSIRQYIDQLNSANQDLKNKLAKLEKSTMDLDWNDDSLLIRGNAVQPPLSRILEEGNNFYIFFSSALTSINTSFRTLNVRSEKTMSDFENNLKLNLKSKVVINYLALVQYVGNEKAVI